MPSVEHLYGWSVVGIECKNHNKSTTELELFTKLCMLNITCNKYLGGKRLPG